MGTLEKDFIDITHGYNNNKGPAFFLAVQFVWDFLQSI